MKQVLTTYINHSRHLIPDGIHRHECLFYFLREASIYPYNAERQARDTLLPFLYRLWYDAAGDRTHDLPHSKADALPLSYGGGG